MDSTTRNWISTLFGSTAAMAIGAADMFYFHAAGTAFDVTMIIGSLAGLGVHVALTTPTALDTSLSPRISKLEQEHPNV